MKINLSRETDPEIARVIQNEAMRQQSHLALIASGNIASQAVMAVQCSILTNKYAEGYPEKRYHGGCEFVDRGEQMKIIGGLMAEVLRNPGDEALLKKTGDWVQALCDEFPLYPQAHGHGR